MQQMFRPLGPSLIRSMPAPGLGRRYFHFFQDKPLPFPSLSRYISSSGDKVKDQFTVSYLVKSCGLTLKSAESASQKVQLKTIDNPNAVISLLKMNDFSQAQIAKVVRSSPCLLEDGPESTLLPKIEFFKSKGFSGSQIAKVICSCPALLTRSLENQIVPAYDALRKVCQSDYRTVVVIRTFPFYLVKDVDVLLARNCSILYDIGVPQSSIIKLLTTVSWALSVDPDKLKKVATKFRDEMGLDPSKYMFLEALGVVGVFTSSKWESKLHMFKEEWNLSEQQVLAGFRHYPKLMTKSEDKIKKVMELLVHKLGWDASVIIIKYPKFLGYSLEKRLLPRASVLLHLVSIDSIKKEKMRSPQMFTMTDDCFLQKYVNDHREAPVLLKLFGK